MPSSPRGLEQYRERRHPDLTPEPFGSEQTPPSLGPLRFVVQKHAASRMHYDFRIELGGVLLSWAVPKGPSLDSSTKRLAIRVEDHPLDYLDFEGVIPAPCYGAGSVIVWDQGVWFPTDDPKKAMAKGHLSFDLRGYKLRGRFSLLRTNASANARGQWLLVKDADKFADGQHVTSDVSIFSGLLVEERAHVDQRIRALDAQLTTLGVPEHEVDARELRPMLCTRIDKPFTDPSWLYELKYDGYRSIAEVRKGRAVLRYRQGLNTTARFPEVRRALELLPCSSCVLDGELVVFDSWGHPDFGLVQARGGLSRARDIETARRKTPVTYVVFDLLELNGRDLRALPLSLRKTLLARTVPTLGPIKYCEHIEEAGEAFFARIEERQLEGMIAKRKDSTYGSGRSPAWKKLHCPVTGDFVIVGYALSTARPEQFAALHLAAFEGETLRYAGKVGSGFASQERLDLQAKLDALPRVAGAVYQGKSSAADVWVKPSLVARQALATARVLGAVP